MSRYVVSCLLAVAVVLFSNCHSVISQESNPTKQFRNLIAQTPRQDTEAELMALWLSNEIVAPESLYVEIREALKRVREQYSSTIPKVEPIHFTSDLEIRSLVLVLCQKGVAQFRAGQHRDIDSLTEILNGKITDTLSRSADRMEVHIRFNGYLNFELVGKMYMKMENVCDLHFAGYIEPSPTVIPWRLSDGRLTLLFCDIWRNEFGFGPNPVAFYGSEFWYFRVSSSDVEYVGNWVKDNLPEPSWWPEAKAGYAGFNGVTAPDDKEPPDQER